MFERSLTIGRFFRTIYEYRAFLQQSVARDLKRRYKRSVLGYCWSMLHPLLMMCILALVFSYLLQAQAQDYAVFLFIGMLPWQVFQGTVLGCMGIISNSLKLMEQVPVPKFVFPVSIGVSNMVNMLLSVVPLLLLMLLLRHGVPWTVVGLPLVLVPLFMATMGVALLVATANVFFDDTHHLTQILLQALYFLSPILYGPEHLPPWLVRYLKINPMFGIIESLRDMFYEGRFPDAAEYGLNFLICTLCLMLGLWAFHKAEDKFVYFV